MTAKTEQKPDNIYTALLAAQMEMGKARKTKDNPHFRSKYADLAEVQEACLPALHKHGFVVFQPTVKMEDGWAVETIFHHAEFGERLSTTVPLILGKGDMQGFKSAVTYARRIGLENLGGIAPEDDDGNEAAKQAPPKFTPKQDWTVEEEPGLSTGVKGAQVAHDASPAEKARAYADRIVEQFWEAKRADGVEGVWRRNEAVIERLKANYDDLYQSVFDAYKARLNAINEGQAA